MMCAIGMVDVGIICLFFCSELSFFASSELFLVCLFLNFLFFLWKKSFLNLTQNFFASSPSLHELFLHPCVFFSPVFEFWFSQFISAAAAAAGFEDSYIQT
jgi:hypothetical protein